MRALAIFIFCFCLNGAAGAQEQAKGWLGAELQDVTKQEAEALGWEGPRGAKLVKPLPGGPAEKAGLLPGDILLSADGVEAETVAGFIALVKGKAPGAEIKLRLLRGGKEKRLAVTLGARPVELARAAPKDVPILQLDTGGHMALIGSIAFTPDGRQLVSASDDKTIRVWDLATAKTVRTIRGESAPGDAGQVYAMALSPDGKWLAAGGYLHETDYPLRHWSGEIRLWNSGSGAGASERYGRFLRILAKQGTEVGSLSFSPDGKLLLSGNGAARGPWPLRVYEITSGKEIVTHNGHDNVVIATAFSPDGRWAATGGGNNEEIHLWDPHSGKPRPGPDGKPLRLAGQGQRVWAAGFSADGRRIGWGNSGGWENPMDRGPIQQALTLPLGEGVLGAPVALGEAEADAFRRAQASFGGFSLSHRKGGAYGHYDAILDISKDGKMQASIERDATNGLGFNSYTFTQDGKEIISGGGNGQIISYGLDGKRTGDFVGHEGTVWAVAPSPDGRFLVSGAADQTVRLWNLKTRELLVTLYRGADGEWVMWTPQGYYAGSPGADKLVGWQINRGADKAADYVTAEQLRKHLNRPDIVAKAIQLASAEEAVRTSYGTEFKLSDLLARPAPRLRILSPAAEATVSAPDSVAVTIALDATPDPVTRIRIQVNGRQLDDFLPEHGPKFEAGEHAFKVPLAKGRNTIVITALNEIGWSKVQDGTLALTNESAGELDKRGTLYILAIGVTKYPGIPHNCSPRPVCDLSFTGNDAVSFADIVQARLGPLHTNVVRRVLVNGGKSDDAPTAANIVDALGVLADAQANDTVAVFLAGHGFNDGPNYRFVSTDAALANDTIRPSSVVPWYAIEEAIDGAKGRRLLFIDTCHSAGAYNQRLGNAAYYANILAYSAARWDQEAQESPKYKHGLFTQAVVEGLAGAADLNHDGRVDTAELNDYLQKRVPELAEAEKHEQNPQFFKGRDAEVYALAALK